MVSRVALLAAFVPFPTVLAAQSTAPTIPVRTIRGVVRNTADAPIGGANVFVLETLDGTVSGDDGRFTLRVAADTTTLVTRRLGYREMRRTITRADTGVLSLILQAGTVSLTPIAVQAGQFTTGAERGATLTPLEVVMTPGTAADVNRAIQGFPGVQAGDEGTALFVRGGDFIETRVFLNDAALLTPVQLQSPSGTFTGSVDPFLLDGIYFSSGGFGARYGDALSAIVALRTEGRPARSSATATAGLAGVSGAGAIRITPSLSLRASANRSDLDPMFRLNRMTAYDPPPHGHDVSASVIANYGNNGEVKVFGIEQSNALGLGVEEASFQGNFAVRSRSVQGVVSWRDRFGDVTPTVSLAVSRNRNATDFGSFRLGTQWRHAQLFGQTEWTPIQRLTVRTGGEFARLIADFDGTIPSEAHDVKPGSRTTVVASVQDGQRVGLFGETDWRLFERMRVIAGVRTDRSTLTKRRSVDPRISLAWSGPLGATFTAAWGVYHQVPDPLYFDDSLASHESLPSMRAEQRIIGMQLGELQQILRVEVYEKRYADLVQRTRDYDVARDGTGTARGLDVFAKGTVGWGVSGRISYSLVSAHRTDPDAEILARAPFDVTHTVTAIADRALPYGFRAAAAFRHGTGRPFTPVLDATFDAAQQVYVPRYGSPMSERLPAFQRIDLSASYYRPISGEMQVVFFVSMMNVFDRNNVHRYRYNADYSQRYPVAGIFQRSVFFGGSMTWSKEAR